MEVKESKRNYIVSFPDVFVEFLRKKEEQEIIKENGRFIVLGSADRENREYIKSLKKKGGKR